MSFWSKTQQQDPSQPGSKQSERNGEPKSPASRQKMLQKRDLRDLNARLELYVHNTNKKTLEIEGIRNALAKQEIEFRNKIREKESQFHTINEKLRSENETLQYQTKSLHEELQTFENTNTDLQKRVASSEKRVSEKESEIEGLQHQLQVFNSELQSLRAENADIKYKYDNHDHERKTLMAQFQQLKAKNANLMKDLTKRQSENRSQCEAFNRLLTEKRTEMDRLMVDNKELMTEKAEMQDRLRLEFDTKLNDYIAKREQQYKQEKDEWMRIFKQEFNRKLRSYKDANGELSSSNKKLEQDVGGLRARLAKLKQGKTELEGALRTSEEELEKARAEFDAVLGAKEDELKLRAQLIAELKEAKKLKDIEFDEVVGIKIQLAQEIELYRRILSDAEQSAGYLSPLQGGRSKKRKLVGGDALAGTLGGGLGHGLGLGANGCGAGDAGAFATTPGIVRGAQLAREDLNRLETVSKDGTLTDTDAEEENDSDAENRGGFLNMVKHGKGKNKGKGRGGAKGKSKKRNRKNVYGASDISDGESKDGSDCEEDAGMMLGGDGVTPGGEPWPLQFSTMDLTNSMIEIQNISDDVVSLCGYTLSNSDGSAQYQLPNDRVLKQNEKLKVMIGMAAKHDGTEACILWKADVWAGDEEDVARLYDPNSQEIARIEIHPDMLPNDKKDNGNCLVM